MENSSTGSNNIKQIKVESMGNKSGGNIKVREEVTNNPSNILAEMEDSGNIRVNVETAENLQNKNTTAADEEDIMDVDDPFADMSILDDLCFLEEFNQLETPSSLLNSQSYLRLTVIEQFNDNFLNTKNSWENQKKLVCLHRPSEQSIIIYLRSSWYQTRIKIGEIINLIGHINFENECIVDDESNLVIINCDLLINSTQIASSYSCLRSSILQNKSTITGSYSKPLIIGQFLHDLLEACLMSNCFNNEFMNDQLDRLIKENGDILYSADLTEEGVIEDLNLGKEKLQRWAKKYVSQQLKPNKFSKISHKFENILDEPTEFSVKSAKSTEELIWSPKYGIKGKIDLIVELIRNDAENNEKLNLVPLEFKTGKVGFNLNYEVQTMLYQLLLSEKYNYDPELGLIFLLNGDEDNSEQLIKIHSIRNRLIGLIQARNSLASYLGEIESNELPNMIRNKYICGRCNQLQSCMLTHKAYELETQPNLKGVEALYEQLTSHLTPSQIEFYKKWDNFLNIEEGYIKIYKKDIWSKSSKELEAQGKCFSEMMLVGYIDSSEWVNVIEFKKLDLSSTQQQDKSLLPANFAKLETNTPISVSQPIISKDPLPNTTMEVGDPVVISTESGIFGIAVGFIVQITLTSIKIALSKEFRPPLKKSENFNNQSNQKFQQFEDYNDFIQSTQQVITNNELFRIDKDEYEQGLKLLRGNLISLMTNMNSNCIRLRELIIDLKPPKIYKPSSTNKFPRFNSNGKLNSDQEKACESAINNEDYTLILGMPGTGKTTTIAHLVKHLIEIKNQTILITSYTHSSLDHILIKLVELGITNFLRLGSLNKVHNDIKKFCINHPDNKTKSIGEAERIYGKTPIIATTCLGMGHFLFDKRKFNYTIIDEASQLTLPTSIAPLLVSNKFILVGDHYQLPPLLKDKDLQKDASNTSLFKLLAERYPNSVNKIRYQYRMNFDIMKLSNKLIYSDSLHCGNDEVANSKLELDNRDWVKSLHTVGNSNCFGSSEECWLKYCLNPNNSVIFLNTQKLKNYESREGELLYNTMEIDLIDKLITSFNLSGLPLNRIGILSPYKKQTILLSKKFEKLTNLEILTIDKSQGRDKDLIIISLVRSNSTEKVGSLLKDWKRINVALTRSRFKLILVGNKATLMGGTFLFRELINILLADDKVFNLEDRALDDHEICSLTESGGEGLSINSTKMQVGGGVRNASVSGVAQENSQVLREFIDQF